MVGQPRRRFRRTDVLTGQAAVWCWWGTKGLVIEPSCEPDPPVRWWGVSRFPLGRSNVRPARGFHTWPSTWQRFRNEGLRAGSVVRLMGSLIKKRRKRMRKKKHKKMLKRTRFQRRAKGK